MRARHRLVELVCLAWLVGLAGGSVACRPLCPTAKELGGEKARFSVHLLAEYTPGGPYTYSASVAEQVGRPDLPSCRAMDGVQEGIRLDMRGVDTHSSDMTCDALVAAVENPPAALQLLAAPRGTPASVSSVYDARVGDCGGVWGMLLNVYLTGSNATIFDMPVSGELPKVVVGRTFQPFPPGSAPSECVQCSDAFVARLERRR